MALHTALRKKMRGVPVYLIFLIAIHALTGCDAHDYWQITETLEVDSEKDVLKSISEDSIEQDLFVRYQLDYELTNPSDTQSTEVVVSATSYVNAIERATGQKVWHLAPSEVGQGILSTTQLQLGNALVVTLACCEQSRCTRKEVLCPTDTENLPDVSEIADFCYGSCTDPFYYSYCILQCPGEEACDEYCKDSQNIEQCRKDSCGYGGEVASCLHHCTKDDSCLETCTPTDICTKDCMSLVATCFGNCLATWTQCTDDIYEPDTELIPCALCGGDGLCKTNFDTTEKEGHTLTGEDGTEYPCDIDCHIYPAECFLGCEDAYDDDSGKMTCMSQCIRQHQFWCNDYTIPVDYVDTQGGQPCCFENHCQSSFKGVVKTYDVECFNDTSCSSGKYCSDEGICVSNGSSCQGLPLSSRRGTGACFILLCMLMLGFRRCKMRSVHDPI